MTPPRTADLPRHPIRVVVERTGLSEHVLRAWERRYSVVQPRRGERGRRLYSDSDVERLALLNQAARTGRSVATLVELPIEELRQIVAEDAENASRRPSAAGQHIGPAMAAVRNLDPERLESLLRRALLSLGCIPFLEEVVSPMMVQIGEEWHAGQLSIAHEHAATATVVQLLGGLTRDLALPDAPSRLVIATPRGEAHAVGAMIAAAAAAHDGWHVTWLGSDLPAAQIASAAAQGRAQVVAIGLAGEAALFEDEVTALRSELAPHIKLWAGGNGAERLPESHTITRVRDLTHWRSLLRVHASPASRS